MRETKKFHRFFHFSKLFFIQNTVCFPMHGDQKISWWRICSCGERSTSKSACVVPAWSLTAFGDRSASSVTKFSSRVNPDLENGSFWLEIRDAEHVDRCSWNIRKFDRINWPLTSEMFTFWVCLQWSWLKAVSVHAFVLGGLRGSTATSSLVDGSSTLAWQSL